MRKISSSKQKWNEKNGLDRFPFNITSHFQPEIFYESFPPETKWKGKSYNKIVNVSYPSEEQISSKIDLNKPIKALLQI